MSKRKTVAVTEIVNQLNKNLKNSDLQDFDSTEGVAFRKGICAAIEQILFSTGKLSRFQID